jgi:hypothetical protein
LSLWRFLPSGWGLPVLLLATAAATWIAARRGPRGGSGLLVGSGLILMTFDLLNKQTFLNQWWLACVLVIAGVAVGHGGVVDGEATCLPRRARSTDVLDSARIPRPGVGQIRAGLGHAPHQSTRDG